jgi:hypothetical protein
VVLESPGEVMNSSLGVLKVELLAIVKARSNRRLHSEVFIAL